MAVNIKSSMEVAQERVSEIKLANNAFVDAIPNISGTSSYSPTNAERMTANTFGKLSASLQRFHALLDRDKNRILEIAQRFEDAQT